ncbi:MFS transporter [Gemmatimonas sp.]|uniref:MFS transporter n=1 Tax=Gemmatimonas sp. TaxID=1962908 RepID=UPI0027B8A4D0|nr:MFS transporter [Gemmatimonas sp.]
MADAQPGDVPDTFAALRLPNFRRYILALFTLTLGIQIQGTVVGWQIYDLTRDPLALGLVGLAEALPAISMSLVAGHVADTHDRRRVALLALSALVGCSLALWWLGHPAPIGGVPLTAPARVRAIYGVIVVSGVARAFLQPARQALSAELVPRTLYQNAVTWRSGSWQLAAVLGPALGGILYAIGGVTLSYAVDAVLMAFAVLGLVSVRHTSPVRESHDEPIRVAILGGLRFVFGDALLLSALSLDLFSVLFGGAVALLPVFAGEILHAGPTGLGLLRAAPAAGAVVASVLLTRFPPFAHSGRNLLLAVTGFGLCSIGFGLSRNLPLSIALLALGGASDMVSVVIRSLMLQMRTPEALLGRVSSVNQIFIGSSNEIGAFESGLTARWWGAVTAVVVGGIATLGVAATVAWRVPALRKLRQLRT